MCTKYTNKLITVNKKKNLINNNNNDDICNLTSNLLVSINTKIVALPPKKIQSCALKIKNKLLYDDNSNSNIENINKNITLIEKHDKLKFNEHDKKIIFLNSELKKMKTLLNSKNKSIQELKIMNSTIKKELLCKIHNQKEENMKKHNIMLQENSKLIQNLKKKNKENDILNKKIIKYKTNNIIYKNETNKNKKKKKNVIFHKQNTNDNFQEILYNINEKNKNLKHKLYKKQKQNKIIEQNNKLLRKRLQLTDTLLKKSQISLKNLNSLIDSHNIKMKQRYKEYMERQKNRPTLEQIIEEVKKELNYVD